MAKKIEDFPKNFSSTISTLEDFLSFGKYTELRGLSGRISSARMIQILKLLGTVVPSVTAIIQVIQYFL